MIEFKKITSDDNYTFESSISFKKFRIEDIVPILSILLYIGLFFAVGFSNPIFIPFIIIFWFGPLLIMIYRFIITFFEHHNIIISRDKIIIEKRRKFTYEKRSIKITELNNFSLTKRRLLWNFEILWNIRMTYGFLSIMSHELPSINYNNNNIYYFCEYLSRSEKEELVNKLNDIFEV